MGDDDEIAVKQVVIPYRPRRWFLPLHQSVKRNVFLVAHRRAGKSVSIANHLIRAGLKNNRPYPPPRYGYIGPTFKQTKDLIWGYMKHYTSPIEGTKFSESELQCTLPNGAMINLYGGDSAYEAMRGLYFDGAAADEYALLNPDMRESVLIPCLADYRGFFIGAGTSNGDDHFHKLKRIAEENPDTWDLLNIPVTQTTALHPEEVEEMRRSMSPDKFAREMMCSFEAPVEGSYYGDLMNEAGFSGRITRVPHDPSVQVFTWWDLGIDDEMFIWFIQRAGRELHAFRTMKFTGKGITQIAPILKQLPYNYALHVMPHDVMAREITSGRSRYEVASEVLGNIFVAPMTRVEDGIEAARTVVPMVVFSKENASDGILALRNYSRGRSGQPIHNWSSHGADAFRIGSVALNQTIGYISSRNVTSISGRLRRRIRGLA
jgi:phage terminase large subunit